MEAAEEILENYIGGYDPFIHSQFIKAMKEYANVKLEEAAESALVVGDFWGNKTDRCSFFDTENGVRMTVDKESILILKDEV